LGLQYLQRNFRDHWHARCLQYTMSNSEHDPIVLGKRVRDGNERPDEVESIPSVNETEDDDDVGPMPMPEAAANGAKKKRKSVCIWHVYSGAHEADMLFSSSARAAVLGSPPRY
jgi:hypothetical protein